MTWEALSEYVLQQRHLGKASTTNETLLHRPDGVGRPDLAATFRLWAGDNLQMESKFEDALALYASVIDEGGELFGYSLPAAAATSLASCRERIGDYEGALELYRSLPELGDKVHSPAWIQFRVAELFEMAGATSDAIAAYSEAAGLPNDPDTNLFPITDLAARAARRASEGPRGLPTDATELASVIAAAIQKGDLGALTELASPTHFSIGPHASHRYFVEAADMLERLANDFRRSTPTCDLRSTFGSGGKQYIPTAEWRGDWFAGRVDFLLTRHLSRWEWSGLVLHEPTTAWLEEWTVAEPGHNQPLAIEIKAPWPAGEQFRAGGLVPYVGEQLRIALTGAIPFIGGILVANLVAEYASRACGWGPGVLYYNSWPTHLAPMDAFAIDFVRYEQFQPLPHDISGRSDALAAGTGLVTPDLVVDRMNGDSEIDNHVEIRHLYRTGTVRGSPAWTGTPYRSRYLHLAGSPRVRVSAMMGVRQGTRLGRIDDTGNSLFDHLHFEMRDDDRSGATVKPTPMDGVTLREHEDGKCVPSTNIPFP